MRSSEIRVRQEPEAGGEDVGGTSRRHFRSNSQERKLIIGLIANFQHSDGFARPHAFIPFFPFDSLLLYVPPAVLLSVNDY